MPAPCDLTEPHPDDDGQPDALVGRIARAWTPSRERPTDDDTPIMPAIRAACRHWDILEVASDPDQLHQPMVPLRTANIVWVHPLEQGPLREQGDKQRDALIREGRIHHCGTQQPALRAPLGNAHARLTGPAGDRLRIVKRSAGHPVDLVVAFSLAAWEGLRIHL